MTESLRDLLRQGADTVERPQLDLDQLVAEAERRLVRRRLTVVVAAAAAVAVVTAGGLALRPDEGRESPAPPDLVETPDPEPGSATYLSGPADDQGDPLPGAFSYLVQEQSDIYLRSGPEAPRRIIATDADERCPTVSSDGASLAYLSGPYDVDGLAAADVVVVPLDSAGDPELGSRQVVLRNVASCPQWSPDGRRLAVLSEGEDWTTTELHVVTLDGKERLLAILPPYMDGFAWSPEGDAVAYLTEDAVWIAPLDGGEPELFWRSTPTPDTDPQGVPLPRAPQSLSWLSTGELAVVVLGDDADDWPYVPQGPRMLHIIDVESERHEKLELSEAFEGQVVWSPDDSRLAVEHADATQILVHDRATNSTFTLRPRLDDGPRIWINGVAWSADGERLLTDAQRGSDSEGGPFALIAIALDGRVEVLTPWTRVRE